MSTSLAPPIQPRSDAKPRPLWSVMIPTYNCANYLRQTLSSVLAQDPGPTVMQIEIIDDCSTKDNPHEVARELAGERVEFYRQPANAGATANFNACIARSRGHLVHILHGDDWVAPSFYERTKATFDKHPECALVACRSIYVEDAAGCTGLSPAIYSFFTGSRDSSPLWYENPLRTPASVVRRSFYEQHGGFDQRFPHVADWEMWERCVRLGGGVQLNELLAFYREHPGSDTGKLAREGRDLADYMQLASHFAACHDRYDLREMRRRISNRALSQAVRFRQNGDSTADAANLAYWHACTTRSERVVIRLQAALNRRLDSIRQHCSR